MERWAVPWGWPCLYRIVSVSVSNPRKKLHGSVDETENAPKLQMHHPLDAILRYIVVVEERVRYARDAEEQDAGCGEEEGAEVGSLGGLGDGGVDGDEGRFLDRLVAGFLDWM